MYTTYLAGSGSLIYLCDVTSESRVTRGSLSGDVVTCAGGSVCMCMPNWLPSRDCLVPVPVLSPVHCGGLIESRVTEMQSSHRDAVRPH